MNRYKFSIYILSFCFFSVIISNSLFIHFHILPDGSLIKHSHPYSQNQNENPLFPKHNHSETELVYISALNDIFSTSITVLIIAVIFNLFFSFKSISYHIYLQKQEYNSGNLRAPPIY